MTIGQAITLSKILPLENAALLAYMAERGIPAEVCQKYLREFRLYNTKSKKHFNAVGMLNEEDGYELQNEFYSGWINSNRDVSFIRGRKHGSDRIHVFFNMNDFLAMAARETKHSFIADAIILHSFDLLHKVPPYLNQYGYKQLYSWMPNNDYGKTAVDTLSAYCMVERNLNHQAMNRFFPDYETIGNWCAAAQSVTKA